jgi:lipoprotein-releasing system ATP-binding protein
MSKLEASAVAISCKGLTKTYVSGPQPITVLSNVTLSVQQSESVAIVGASGSGKSTLLHLLGGLDSATAGEVHWGTRALSALKGDARDRARNETLGFVYQFHHLIGELTALENVALPLRIRRLDVPTAQARASELLKGLGLGERMTHLPSELSGGERQRTAIARALAGNASCILADEPTGNLDRHNADRVFETLTNACKQQGAALVLVTHAAELAERCDRVFHLVDGVLQN